MAASCPLARRSCLTTSTLPRVDGGGVFVGERGILVYETYGNNPKVYPAELAAQAERVPKSVPRIDVSHEENWVKACKGEAKASCPFDYAAPLTEVMLLGIVALRAGQGQKIEYDAANMKVKNSPAANAALTREYRHGVVPVIPFAFLTCAKAAVIGLHLWTRYR